MKEDGSFIGTDVDVHTIYFLSVLLSLFLNRDLLDGSYLLVPRNPKLPKAIDEC